MKNLDKRTRKKRVGAGIILFFILSACVPMLANITDIIFSGNIFDITLNDLSYYNAIQKIIEKESCWALFLVFETCVAAFVLYYVLAFNTDFSTDMYKVTEDVYVPRPTGQGQYGNAWFLERKKYKKAFSVHYIKKNDELIKKLIEAGINDRKAIEEGKIPDLDSIQPIDENTEYFSQCGMVVGIKKEKWHQKETIYTIDHDSHLLCIGATRFGKTRRTLFVSAAMSALAGESQLINDIKGEVADYMTPFYKRLGYITIRYDFKEPEKSVKYNLLQPIINEVKYGKLNKVEEMVADLASMMVVRTNHTAPVWPAGEQAMIELAILCVVLENVDHPQYQNLYNAYYFLAEMSETAVKEVINTPKGQQVIRDTKLNIFMEELRMKNPHHLALKAYAAAVSAGREAGEMTASFIKSAMQTLRPFSYESINAMTNESDFTFEDLNDKKTVIFLVFPDQKETYYKIASVFVASLYDGLSQIADKNKSEQYRGGRLKRRFRFLLDEFGNMVKISGFTNMLTAGASRGILMDLFVQSYSQISEKYSQDTMQTVKDNCETTIYLHSDNYGTNEEISKRMGNYTTTSRNVSQNSRNSGGSTSTNLIGRRLLFPDEVADIKYPYAIALTRDNPAIPYCPDLSQWFFNDMFGTGSQEHNLKLRYLRGQSRKERDVRNELHPWDIWNTYGDMDMLNLMQVYEAYGIEVDRIKYRTDETYRKELYQKLDKGGEYATAGDEMEDNELLDF